MRTTDGTTTRKAANRQPSQPSQPSGRHRDERGIMTLEWLLIVGAVAGLAATSVLAVQRVVDDTAEVPVDPLVRVLEADIEAAFVAAEADTAALAESYDDADFKPRCVVDLPAAFSDVVDPDTGPRWTPPATIPAILPDQPATLATGAGCVVTLRSGLGG